MDPGRGKGQVFSQLDPGCVSILVICPVRVCVCDNDISPMIFSGHCSAMQNHVCRTLSTL